MGFFLFGTNFHKIQNCETTIISYWQSFRSDFGQLTIILETLKWQNGLHLICNKNNKMQ
jgi:hypothetical protein